ALVRSRAGRLNPAAPGLASGPMRAPPNGIPELPPESPVRAGLLSPGDTYPLLLTPAAGPVDLAAWAADNRAFLASSLLRSGAILFRGFDLASPADFERAAGAVCPGLFGEYGDLPREGVSGKVYGSTPYPASQAILFH